MYRIGLQNYGVQIEKIRFVQLNQAIIQKANLTIYATISENIKT